jgi:hypothetical protein
MRNNLSARVAHSFAGSSWRGFRRIGGVRAR